MFQKKHRYLNTPGIYCLLAGDQVLYLDEQLNQGCPVPCRATKKRMFCDTCRAVPRRAVQCRALPDLPPCRSTACRAMLCRAVPVAVPCQVQLQLQLCRAVPCRAMPCRAVLFRANLCPCRAVPNVFVPRSTCRAGATLPSRARRGRAGQDEHLELHG